MKQHFRTSRGAVFGVLTVGAVVVAIDQLVKWLVVAKLPIGSPITLIPNQLILKHVSNPGAAFSLGSGSTWIFTIFASVMVVTIVVLARYPRRVSWVVALGLIGGGAAGNLVDRLFRHPGFGVGHVVDFIQVPWFAIFNGADIAISCGVVLFVLLVLFGVPFKGTPRSADVSPASGSKEAA